MPFVAVMPAAAAAAAAAAVDSDGSPSRCRRHSLSCVGPPTAMLTAANLKCPAGMSAPRYINMNTASCVVLRVTQQATWHRLTTSGYWIFHAQVDLHTLAFKIHQRPKGAYFFPLGAMISLKLTYDYRSLYTWYLSMPYPGNNVPLTVAPVISYLAPIMSVPAPVRDYGGLEYGNNAI